LIWEEEKQVEKVQILLYFSKLINFYQGEENTVKLGYNELHGTNEIFTSTTVYNNVIKPQRYMDKNIIRDRTIDLNWIITAAFESTQDSRKKNQYCNQTLFNDNQ